MAADAQLAELSLQERKGNTLSVDAALEYLGLHDAELRAVIMAFPGKYAPSAVGHKTIGEGQLALERIANEILETLQAVGEIVRDRLLTPRSPGVAASPRRGRPRGTRAGA